MADSSTLVISADQLKKMIADAIAADRVENPPGSGGDYSAMGDAIAAGIAKNTRRKVTFGEFALRPTKNHPLGPASPKLKRECFQNGFHLTYDTLTDHQVNLLNRITHPGRYINRMVEVVMSNENSEEAIDIRWKDRTRDHMFELKGFARDFTDILEQVVKAQEEEDREEEERKAKPRRHFGDSQNTREALARAEGK